jgi:hypothetical protein
VGGPGSGNFNHKWRPPRKTTAEECLSIDASLWARESILRAGVRQAGLWGWKDTRTGDVLATILYEVNTRDAGDPQVTLTHAAGPQGDCIAYPIRLATTRPPFGGVRWWFTCPVPGPHGPCGRRVGKLHLPPDDVYFGCRRCHRLSYTSSQRSRYDDPLFRLLARRTGFDVAEVKGLLRGFGTPGWSLLG